MRTPHKHLHALTARARRFASRRARVLLVCLALLLTLAAAVSRVVPTAHADGSGWRQTWNTVLRSAGVSRPAATMPAPVLFDGPTAFTNSGAITIPLQGAATPYPSNIVVAGMAGTITKVTVTLNGFSHTTPDDVDVLLVGPAGQTFMVMSDAGGTSSAVTNLTLTFDDAAASLLPDNTVLSSGTFRPTDYGTNAGMPPGGAPVAPYNEPATAGAATFASVFNGLNPNGTWSLFVGDDTGGDSGSLSGGWTITITTASLTATSTMLVSSINPSFTTAPNNSPTFTATVTAAGNPVTTGTVTFTEGVTPLASNVAVNGSGQAAFSTSALTEGSHVITATYSGDATFGQSNGSMTQVVNNHTVVNGTQYCNPGAITIPSSGGGTPYPSNIFVSGVAGVLSTVTLTLNGFSHTTADDVDVLLVGPGGQKFMVMSDAGGQINASNLTLTFADAGAALLPQNAALASGTFKPTDYGAGETMPAPAPGLPYDEPGTAGTDTFASVFTGSANGTWNLYVADDTSGDSGSISGGWCLNITTVGGTATTTMITSSLNPSFTTAPNNAVTFTATVRESPSTNLVTTGTVTFAEGVTTLAANVAVNGSGQAAFSTSSLTEGNHVITATYNGTVSFGASNASLTQVVNNHTAINGNQFCNQGAVSTGDGGIGNPYPSRIFVTGQGAICTMTLTLNGFSHTDPDDVDILLVGPGGQKFLVMSDVGGDIDANNLTLTLDDAAGSPLPDAGPLASGTFKPTNVGTGESLLAPAPAAPYDLPAPAGAATFTSVFKGDDPNGTWSLYVVDDTSSDTGSISGGWCLTFSTIGITPATLPNAVFGQSYSQALTGTGGTGPYTFSHASGTQPASR